MKLLQKISLKVLLLVGVSLMGVLAINNNAYAGDIPYIWRDYGNFQIRGEKDNFEMNKTKNGGCATYMFNSNQIDECDQNSSDWLKVKPVDTDYLHSEVIGENNYSVYWLLQGCNISHCAPDRAYVLSLNNKSFVIKGMNINDLRNGNIKFNKSPVKTEIKNGNYSGAYISPKKENLNYELSFNYNPKKIVAEDYYEQGQGAGYTWYADGAGFYDTAKGKKFGDIGGTGHLGYIGTIYLYQSDNKFGKEISRKVYGVNTLVKYEETWNTTKFFSYYVKLPNKKVVSIDLNGPVSIDDINDIIQISSIAVKDIKKAKVKEEVFKITPGSILSIGYPIAHDATVAGERILTVDLLTDKERDLSTGGGKTYNYEYYRYTNTNKTLRDLAINSKTTYKKCVVRASYSGQTESTDVSWFLTRLDKELSVRPSIKIKQGYDDRAIYYFDIQGTTITSVSEPCLP